MRFLLKLLLPLLLVITTAAYYEYQRFISTPINVGTGETFAIESGSNLQQISNRLTKKGITDFPSSYLYWYGRFNKSAHLIKAGEYRLKPSDTLPQLLTQFIDGQVVQHAFTIVEGMTSQQLIAALVADERLNHVLGTDDLKDIMLIMDGNSRHGEGEFAPETYYFSAGATDKGILKRAYQLMQDNLAKAWLNKADKLPYKTPYEALIMASIIEKETGNAAERPEIAGVFVRRLNKGMRLQTDPTVIYGIGEHYNGNIRKKDLRRDTPYNTYTRQGLPPSPIALPSKAAIVAALNPAAGKTLYFVAMGQEGRHVFSKNLTDHNKAVRKYQLKR